MARSSGGIGDSGVFGLIGTTVQCDAEDKSMYCTAAKLVNVFIWLLILFFVLKFAFEFLKKKR